jgi:multidrug efflux pump subunit AcrB
MIHNILKRPLIVFLVAVMLLGSGILSLIMLPIKLQPSVPAPFLLVSASTEQDIKLDEMEKEAALPLETIALNSEWVNEVNVTTTTRNVSLQIILRDSVKEEDIDKLRNELNEKLNNTPLDFERKEVRQFSTADSVMMWIKVTSDDLDQEAVRKELKDIVVPALRKVKGVSKVEHTLDQYQQEYIFELIPSKVKSLEKASQIIEELKNSVSSPLLGTLEYDGNTYRVRSEAAITNRQELEQFRFSTGETLADIATLKIDRESDRFYRILNDKPYYEIDVYASDSASEVKISEQVRSIFNTMQAEQHTHWDYLYAWDASKFIGQTIKELTLNILIGALIASIILYLVFRNMRTMLIIGISMPISICSAFLFMYMAGYSLNIVTLMGIGLATGMIVDACIVVIENIFRKIQDGLERTEAVLQGTKEVLGPVISSILTTISVFLPIAFLDGMIGAFMKQLALTVTVSLAASLFVAISVIPILSHRMVQYTNKTEKVSRWMNGYEHILVNVLKHKWKTFFAFILVLVISVYSLVAFVPKNYVPNVSDRSLYIQFEVDENIAFETTKEMMDQTVQDLLKIDGVANMLYWTDEYNPHTGVFYVLYEPKDEMEQSDEEANKQIEQTIRGNIPITFLNIGQGNGDSSGQMSISAKASSMNELMNTVPMIQEEIGLFTGVTGTEVQLTEESREWVIDFSKEQLRHFDIPQQQIEQYLRLVLNGVRDIEMNLNGDEISASLQFPENYRESSDALYRLPLKEDVNLTLNELADLHTMETESRRIRQDGDYQMPITIYFDPEQKQQVLDQINVLFQNNPYDSIGLAYSGTQQQQTEGFQKLLIAVGVSFAAVFLILTIQFNRLRQPFIIMASLPFAMIGVSAGFLITGRVFDMLAMIGIVMLVGIVVNNAIVLIDFINKHRDEYDDLVKAVIEGSKLRIRPILTTTLTTVGGLFPMFLGGSESSDFQTPLATAVVFGLLFSTFVSLLLLPAMYLIFEGKKKFSWPFKKRKPVDIEVSN